MKSAFLFNVAFSEYQGHYYSTNLTQTLWNERYLKYFDEIVVVGRSVKAKSDPTGKRVRSDNERVRFRCFPEFSVVKRLFTRRKAEKFIEDAIRDCDCVICRGIFGVNVCKKLNKPYVIESVQDPFDSYWNHSLIGKAVAIPIFLKTKRMLRNSDYVLYVTEDYLQRRYPTNGISVGVSDVELTDDDYLPVLEKRKEKIQSKESGSRFVLGTAAAVNVAYKGQKYVIKALSVLKKRGYTDYVYQLAGNGSQSRLKKYAAKFGVSEQVVFCGAIPHDRMNEWYDSLDIYIQPSLQEGLPRALAEAIRRALPCIGFRTGGIPELLDESSVLNRHMGKAKRIADKLEEYRSRETLLALAERNAKHSERYCGKVLNEKRDRFYAAFTKSVGTEQNDNGQR